MEQEKINLYKWGRVALVLLVVFLGAKSLETLKQLQGVNPVSNTISVSGQGEVVSVPDVATFNFTVSADAKAVADAQSSVTTKMNAIITALKGAGIEDKDIKTDNYNVYPKYTYTTQPCSPEYCPPSRSVPDGYTASHNVTVKVRKTDDAGKMLGTVGDKGATNISGISFTQDDPEGSIQAAREEAIKDAKEKAKVLAKQLGVRLGKLVNYSDNQGYPTPYYYAADMMGGAKMESAVAPTIPQGESKTKVTVNVIYEIR